MSVNTSDASARYRVFRCHDAHEQAAKLQGWHQSYWQLSAGAFEGQVSSIDTGGVCIMLERLNQVLLQRGALPPGCVAVSVPLHLAGHAMLSGRRSHLQGLHVFSGADGFEYLSPDTHLLLNVQIYPQGLAAARLQGLAEQLAARVGPSATVIDLPEARMDALREALMAIVQAVSHSPALLDTPAVREALERSVLDALLHALDPDPAADAAPCLSTQRSWQLAKAARQHLDEGEPDSPLSVAELVSVLGVSRRTLQYAFQDALGMNPASYLRTARLNRVRDALPHATSVTEAATRFGFWHFGHFATEYRALFHERPSDTLRRCRAALAA